ncbi:MbeD/MobD family mobilization/exclusion protein [Escherichia coli]
MQRLSEWESAFVELQKMFSLTQRDNAMLNGKRLVRTVLIFTESSDQLSRATDRVPGLPASPGYVQ